MARGAGLAPGDAGYHPLTAAFGFLPKADGANFGAAGGGSLANAITRDLYVGFTVIPGSDRRLSLAALRSGALYPYSNRPFTVQLRYRVGTGAFQNAAGPVAIKPETHTPTGIALDLSGIDSLRNLDQPVELRLYFFSTAADARWCRAGLKSASNLALTLVGNVRRTALPAMEIKTRDSGLLISFPGSGGLVALRTTTNLAPPITWKAWPGASNARDGQLQYEIATSEAQRFFQLIEP